MSSWKSPYGWVDVRPSSPENKNFAFIPHSTDIMCFVPSTSTGSSLGQSLTLHQVLLNFLE